MAAIVAFGLSRSQFALAGVLTALAAGFAALVALEWSAPVTPSPIEASPPAAVASNEPAPVFTLAPLSTFSAVTDRPLFSPDRRPAPQASEALSSWSGLSLAGIIVTPASREVLIAHGNPAKLVHLQEGQSVEGWVVRAIEPDHIVVANGSEEHELRFLAKKEGERSARGNPRGATTQGRN